MILKFINLLIGAITVVALYWFLVFGNCLFWATVQYNSNNPPGSGGFRFEEGWACVTTVLEEYKTCLTGE